MWHWTSRRVRRRLKFTNGFPFKRDAKLLGKHEQAKMQILTEAKEQVDEHRDY